MSDARPTFLGFYVPYCIEDDGRTQPIATALGLDAGKNLCREHFVKRCRTLKLLLPQQQKTEIPHAMLEGIYLEWTADPNGEYRGQVMRCTSPQLAALAKTVYKLAPTG
jgi:hypothetical protein